MAFSSAGSGHGSAPKKSVLLCDYNFRTQESLAAIILDINKAWQSVSMRTILLPAIFAASAIGLACIGRSQPAYAAACPDPSTLTSINDNGDATSFDAITGGSCSGTPDSYGVTIYKMGFCKTDPRPSQGASPDYSSCSITFENSSGTAANFAAGTSSFCWGILLT